MENIQLKQDRSLLYRIFILLCFFNSQSLSAKPNVLSYGLEQGIFTPVHSKTGMVVSVNAIASKIGLEVLKKGGNAIDAAVAVGYALAVTHPQAGNIGGGGFMLVRTHK